MHIKGQHFKPDSPVHNSVHLIVEKLFTLNGLEFFQAACQTISEAFAQAPVRLFVASEKIKSHSQVQSNGQASQPGHQICSWPIADSQTDAGFRVEVVESLEQLFIRVSSNFNSAYRLELASAESLDEILGYYEFGPLINRELEFSPAEELEKLKILDLVSKKTISELKVFLDQRENEKETRILNSAISCFPGMVFAKDLNKKYVLANNNLCEIHRCQLENVLGKTYAEISPQPIPATIEASDLAALNGERTNYEHTLEFEDQPRHFHSQKAPVYDQQGQVTGICGLSVEVTEQKKAEAALAKSNAWQAALLEHSELGICALSKTLNKHQYKIDYYNNCFEQIAQLSDEEIRHTFPRQNDEQSLVSKILQEILNEYQNSGNLTQHQIAITDADDQPVYFEVTTTELALEPEFWRLVIFLRDVTEYKLAQLKLEENQLRYQLATEYSGVSVWEWNTNTGHVKHDGNLNKMLGYADINNQDFDFWISVIHPDEVDSITRECEKLVSGEISSMKFRKRMKHANGEWKWFSCRAQYKNHDRTTGIVIGTDRDVTEQVQTTEEKNRLENELLNITRLTLAGELAAGLTHEVTQPVTAIRNYAAASRKLLETPTNLQDSNSVSQYIKKIEENASDAADVLDGIRSLIKPHHRLNEEFELVSLSRIVEQALTITQSELRTHQVETNVSSSTEQDRCWAHSGLLIHVLVNLITNACQAMQQNEKKTRILKIQIFMQNKSAGLFVGDNGPGIPAEVCDKLFEPFVTTKKTSMGMGLAICRRIMEAHSGTITLQPNPSLSTCFEILLPSAQ